MPYEPIKLPDRVQLPEVEAIQKSQIFFEYMCKRHSVRDFSSNPIPKKIIENIIAAAGRAPSGANQQPWYFVAIKDLGMKKRIREAAEKGSKIFILVEQVMSGFLHWSLLELEYQNLT